MEENADALAALTRRMAAPGATRPESWARSEISENFPQQARYLVLRRIWKRRWRHGAIPGTCGSTRTWPGSSMRDRSRSPGRRDTGRGDGNGLRRGYGDG
jgi:hypothetical protein